MIIRLIVQPYPPWRRACALPLTARQNKYRTHLCAESVAKAYVCGPIFRCPNSRLVSSGLRVRGFARAGDLDTWRWGNWPVLQGSEGGLSAQHGCGLIGSQGSSDFIRASGPSPRQQAGHMTEGRQPFTAEIKTLAKGPSTYDPLENKIHK